jgi:hypothetical protein
MAKETEMTPPATTMLLKPRRMRWWRLLGMSGGSQGKGQNHENSFAAFHARSSSIGNHACGLESRTETPNNNFL